MKGTLNTVFTTETNKSPNSPDSVMNITDQFLVKPNQSEMVMSQSSAVSDIIKDNNFDSVNLKLIDESMLREMIKLLVEKGANLNRY